MAKQEARKSISTLKRINKYWYDELTGLRAKEWYEKLGDSSYENILEGNGEWCYCCGKPKSTLQKCHILPHMLGGSEDDSNIFLMCFQCHQENPDTLYSDVFFNYVKNRKGYLDRQIIEIHEHFKNLLEMRVEDRNVFMSNISHSDFSFEKIFTTDYFKGKLGMGCNNQMSTATFTGVVFKKLCENNIVSACDTTV